MARSRSESRSGPFSTGVWDRDGGEGAALSDRSYVATIWVITLLGMMTLAVGAYLGVTSGVKIGWLGFLLLFGAELAGCFISAVNVLPAKVLGLTMIALPMGFILAPALMAYKAVSIVTIASVSVGMVAGLGFVGMLIPRSLASWGSWLFGALWILIIGYIALPFAANAGIPIHGALRLWDWVGVVLFCGITIFDFNRAMRLEKTFFNAFDAGIQVFLDLVNIFIELLSLLGQKND